MKKTLLLTAAALALVSFNANAAESATGTAQVEVVQAIDINHTGTALNFGSVYAKDGNTVTISQAGAKTQGDGFGSTSADRFTISGPNGGSCTVTIPATATMNKTSGTGSITATLDPSVATGSTINLTGTDVDINVGGEIAVSSSTATGSYSGTYTVSIAY